MKKKISLLLWAAILSLFNLLAFHSAFFTFVLEHTTLTGWGCGLWITGLAVVMLIANFLAAYLILYCFRIVGKILIALAHLISTAAVYFVLFYHTYITSDMLNNLFNTRVSEASGFINWEIVLFFILVGVIPAVFILRQRIDYGSLKRFGIVVASSVGSVVVIILLALKQFLWIGEYDTELGALLMPWSYTVNTGRLMAQRAHENKQEIALPDAIVTNNDPQAIVLVIGESARRANCSLYGYERETNPLLAQQEGLVALPARSCATFTTAGVKAILEYKATSSLYEILPNYLYRHGVDVVWRTTNWGEPPVHIAQYQEMSGLDSVLFAGLKQRIEQSASNKVLIILHTSTSHGPKYSTKHPAEFAIYTPENDNVEETENLDALINAYDNTICYTDYLLSNLIDTLRTIDTRDCAMIYISDHGESLGEKNIFMHGLPMNMAPREQYEIPFFVWAPQRTVKTYETEVDQHVIFHSVLDYLGIESPIYDPQASVFE